MPPSKETVTAVRKTLLDNIGKFDHLLSRTVLSHSFILLDLTIDGVAGKLEITREYLRLWLDNKTRACLVDVCPSRCNVEAL